MGYCPEVSFFFQFSAFMMLMLSSLLCVAFAYYHDRHVKRRATVKLRRPLRRGRRK